MIGDLQSLIAMALSSCWGSPAKYMFLQMNAESMVNIAAETPCLASGRS
jgi:hypothetical protein